MTLYDHLPDGHPDAGIGAAIAAAHAADRGLDAPIYGLLKLTERCNMRCSYCPHAGTAGGDDVGDTQRWADVVRQCADLGVRSLNFSGGEPLLRSDLPELIGLARRMGVAPVLLTNGVLLPARLSEVLDAGVGLLIVSLDATDPEPFAANRGSNGARVLDAVERTAAELARRPGAPALTVSAVLTRHNLCGALDLVDWAARVGVTVQFTPVHCYDAAGREALLPIDRDTYRATIAELRRRHTANSDAYLKNFSAFTFSRRLPRGYRCFSGQVSVHVDARLGVRPCWCLEPMGSLLEQPLAGIWQGERARAARARMRALRCARCWMLCTAELSLRWAP